MKKIASLVFAFSLLVLLAAPLLAQEKYTLKSRYPEGKYQMNVVNVTDISTEIQGQKIPANQTQTQYCTITAGPIEADGTQKVVMEITRIASKTKTMGMDMEYDSDDKDSSSPMKAAGIMVGLKLTITFDKDGKQAKIEGLEEFFDEKQKNGDPMEKNVVGMLRKMMKPEDVAKMGNNSMDLVPTEPVAVGDSWETETSSPIPMIGDMKVKSDNKLQSVEKADGKDIAVVQSLSTVKSDEGKEMELGPEKMKFKSMDIESDSTMKIEVATGLMLASDTKMKIKMEMDAGAATMKMEGTVAVTVKIKRLEK